VEAEGTAVGVSIEVVAVPASPVRPARPSEAPLPRTGWEAGALTTIAVALILLGSIVVLLVRTTLERTTTHA
jgi:LPXTG-motif cell wall-anchored protein